MQQTTKFFYRNAMTLAIAALLANTAFAEDGETIRSDSIPTLTVKQILGEPKDEISTLDWFRSNIKTVKKYGFEYSHSIPVKERDRPVVFSIQGPLIKKKTPGLSFEIRF
jgi:hypothetical protein